MQLIKLQPPPQTPYLTQPHTSHTHKHPIHPNPTPTIPTNTLFTPTPHQPPPLHSIPPILYNFVPNTYAQDDVFVKLEALDIFSNLIYKFGC